MDRPQRKNERVIIKAFFSRGIRLFPGSILIAASLSKAFFPSQIGTGGLIHESWDAIAEQMQEFIPPLEFCLGSSLILWHKNRGGQALCAVLFFGLAVFGIVRMSLLEDENCGCFGSIEIPAHAVLALNAIAMACCLCVACGRGCSDLDEGSRSLFIYDLLVVLIIVGSIMTLLLNQMLN